MDRGEEVKIIIAILFGLGIFHSPPTHVRPIGPAIHGHPIHVQSIYPIGPGLPPCFPNCGIHVGAK
jgi:hypothetical protein